MPTQYATRAGAVNSALRQRLRVQLGRDPHPNADIVDSQSVKTTGVGGPRGFDGGKKVTGPKRHLLIDPQGLLVHVVVHPADLPDCDGVTLVLAPGQELSARLRHLWLDGSYKGRGKEWIEATLGWTVSIVQHPPQPRGVWAPADAVIDWAALLPGRASGSCRGGGSWSACDTKSHDWLLGQRKTFYCLSDRVEAGGVDSFYVCASTLALELSLPPLSRAGLVDRTEGCRPLLLETDMSPAPCRWAV